MRNNKISIGIAEDQEVMRSALRTLLTSNNYDVTIEAYNGCDLINLIEKAPKNPSICFVDGRKPVLNGYETILTLKKKYPAMKIIAFTTDTSLGNEMLKIGGDAFLPKESYVQDVLQCISRLIRLAELEKRQN